MTLVVCREVKYTVKDSTSLGTKTILANFKIHLTMSLPKKIEKNSKFLETRSLDYCFCSFFRVVSNIPEYLKNGIKTKVGKMITLMTI